MPPELGPLESEAQPFKKIQPDVSTVLYSLTLKKKKSELQSGCVLGRKEIHSVW